jgi:hypothetical protein
MISSHPHHWPVPSPLLHSNTIGNRGAVRSGDETLSANAAREAHVLGHDGGAPGVDGTLVGVRKKPYHVRLGRLLEREDRTGLAPKLDPDAEDDLADQALEGALANQQVRRLLVPAYLRKLARRGAVALRLRLRDGARIRGSGRILAYARDGARIRGSGRILAYAHDGARIRGSGRILAPAHSESADSTDHRLAACCDRRAHPTALAAVFSHSPRTVQVPRPHCVLTKGGRDVRWRNVRRRCQKCTTRSSGLLADGPRVVHVARAAHGPARAASCLAETRAARARAYAPSVSTAWSTSLRCRVVIGLD